ncbi:unnamed protein product [Brassicogethes aeneus]|uniref:THAP-type domain-containing protein n=1 Tax=Brassicogethes aeneus TaxID=1431903 RepID=A0A9P0BBV2_BRAAE|nr:unnamed protein product [Brassicogethes aeneus]
MGRVCAVKDCNSGRAADNKKRHSLNLKKPKFFKVPKSPTKRQQWIETLSTELTEQNHVCELHFQSNEIQHSYITVLRNGDVNIIRKGRVTLTPRAVPLIVNKDKLLTDLPEPELELEVVCSNTELQNLPKLYDQNKVLYKEIKTEPTDSNEVNATKNCREPVAPSQNQNQNLAPNTYLPFAPNTYLPIGETFIKQEIIDEEEQTFNNLESDHDYSVAESSEPIQKDFAEQCLEYALEYLKQQGDINFSDDITNISNLLEKLKK